MKNTLDLRTNVYFPTPATHKRTHTHLAKTKVVYPHPATHKMTYILDLRTNIDFPHPATHKRTDTGPNTNEYLAEDLCSFP